MHNEMRELRRTLEDFEANKSQELSNLQSSLTKELCLLYRYDGQLFGSFHHIDLCDMILAGKIWIAIKGPICSDAPQESAG